MGWSVERLMVSHRDINATAKDSISHKHNLMCTVKISYAELREERRDVNTVQVQVIEGV